MVSPSPKDSRKKTTFGHGTYGLSHEHIVPQFHRKIIIILKLKIAILGASLNFK